MIFEKRIEGLVNGSKEAIKYIVLEPIVGSIKAIKNHHDSNKKNRIGTYTLLLVGAVILLLSYVVIFNYLIKPSIVTQNQTIISNTTPNPQLRQKEVQIEPLPIQEVFLPNQPQKPSESKEIIPKPLANQAEARGIGGDESDTSNDTALDGEKRVFNGLKNSGVVGNFTDMVKGIFEQFISYTIDPSGHSVKSGDKFALEPEVKANQKLNFNGSDLMNTSTKYSNILAGLTSFVLILLIVLTGIQIMATDNNSDLFVTLKNKLIRLVISTLMVVLFTPILLSSSVIVTNLVNKVVLSSFESTCKNGNKGLDCIITTLSTGIIDKKAEGAKDIKLKGWDVFGWLQINSNNFQGLLSGIVFIIGLVIMFVLLTVIAFQFIFRFINLYLLFVIHPIMSILCYSEKTISHYASYWKQIITLLIQQPLFLIGFIIFGDLVKSLNYDSFQLQSLLITITFSSVLITVPSTLASKLIGEINFDSGVGSFVNHSRIAGNFGRRSAVASGVVGLATAKAGINAAPVIARGVHDVAKGTGSVLSATSNINEKNIKKSINKIFPKEKKAKVDSKSSISPPIQKSKNPTEKVDKVTKNKEFFERQEADQSKRIYKNTI